MFIRLLSSAAAALLCSLAMGGLGVGLGFVLGGALRLAYGLLAFLATGTVVSLLPQADWLRVLSARAMGSVCFAAGAIKGLHDGWTDVWWFCPSTPGLG